MENCVWIEENVKVGAEFIEFICERIQSQRTCFCCYCLSLLFIAVTIFAAVPVFVVFGIVVCCFCY